MSIIFNTSNTSSTNTIWLPTIDYNYSNIVYPSQTYSTSSISVSSTITFKKCRSCNHGHMEGNGPCVESIGMMVTFVSTCNCKEYVPEDNLEYLEWAYEKQQKGLK